jgi:hypothetical protein
MIITLNQIFGRIKTGKEEKNCSLMINLKFYRKHELQQIRKWIKSLPTYKTSLMDGTWQLLDPPIINEVDKSVKAYYTVTYFVCINYH